MSKERLEEILKESPFNQHTEEFLIKLEDMNEITKIVEELEEDLLELVKQNKEFRKSIAFYSSESYNAHLERLLDRREQQNKRYREALNSIMTLWKYSEDRTDFEWLAHKMSDEARKALECDLE